MHLGGHLPPGRRGVGSSGRGGGWQAGWLSHTRSHQSAGVGLAGGRVPLEEGQAVARAEVPAVGGVPTLHPATPGRPPHGRTGLLLPQWHPVRAPRVEETGAPVVRAGGTREEDAGVPPLQRLDGGPLGPKLRATGALDGGPPDTARHGRPRTSGGCATTHGRGDHGGARPQGTALRGGEGTSGAGPPLAPEGGGAHLGGLAVPAPR